jgi:hypothetical protein
LGDEGFTEYLFSPLNERLKRSADFYFLQLDKKYLASLDDDLDEFVKRVLFRKEGLRNPYRFLENNPLSSIDYKGLFLFDWRKGEAGLVCKCCARGVGATVLADLRLEGIDGNDDRGGGNAYRHCLATCRTSKICGWPCASAFWNGRENPNNRAGQQDIRNNNNGIGVFHGGGGCQGGCKRAWRRGDLDCLGAPCPPPA